MVVFGQKYLYLGISGGIRAKVVVFGQSGCIWAKVAVFRQKWLYLGKSGFIRVKVVVIGQSSCIWQNLLSLGKAVVFRKKWFYSGKVVAFGQRCFY